MIELKHIHKEFDGNVILEDVNTTISEGDVVAIIGPSGCGKSTLLNCINLLNPATSGQVIFQGTDLMEKGCNLAKYRQKMGMVFQSFNLFNHMTILENAMHPQISLLGRSRQEAYDKAMKYLKLVGMEDKALRYPDALSGGQKQRAAIARTLSMDPDVILMDEPTSALDPTMVGEVEYVIKKLASEGRTMVVVTHEMNLAKSISNRVFFMSDGGIYEEGPVSAIFGNPEKEKTRQFVNRLKVLELPLKAGAGDLPGALSALKAYGERFGISRMNLERAAHLYEEACQTLLLPHMEEGQTARAVFEYDEKKGRLYMKLYHDGPSVLSYDTEDGYPRMIIENVSKTVSFTEHAL